MAYYNDYKMDFLERERLRQENSIRGWIYIGVDIRFNNMAKIGLTEGRLGTRASGSQNPFYALLCAFKIKEGVSRQKISEIESSVIFFFSLLYTRISHYTSGIPSEWFYIEPLQMKDSIHYFLYENYNMDMYCYHCYDRDMGVIHSWGNPKLLTKSSRPEYQALDLSDPPVDANCYMPGGCGEDCNCWD